MDTVEVRKQQVRGRGKGREEAVCPDTATEDYH